MPISAAPQTVTPLRRFVAAPERILEFIGLGEGETALEIGPGIGYYSVEAKRRLGSSGRLICLDIQRDMLEELRQRLSAASVEVDYVNASAEHLPFRDGVAHHAFLITVLGEIPNRAAALTEVGRVLRPDGHLSVSEQMPDPDFIGKGTLRLELKAAAFVEEKTSGWLWYTSKWRRPAA